VIPGFDLFKGLLIGLLLGGIVGMMTGWRIHGWKTDAATAAVEVRIVEGAQRDVQKARAIDTQNEANHDVVQASAKNALEALKQHVSPTVFKPIPQLPIIPAPTPETPHECLKSDPPTLPAAAVGVLNHAIDGRAPDPAFWSDAQGQAATNVGLFELSAELIAVAAAYHELATDHDALVEWVDGEVKKRTPNKSLLPAR
jgi:hypothetical protein